MSTAELIGLAAGALTTFGFVPQIVRVYLMRSAKEISLSFNLMFLVGVSLWLTYGILLRLPPVILWNVITSMLTPSLLYSKLRYGR